MNFLFGACFQMGPYSILATVADAVDHIHEAMGT